MKRMLLLFSLIYSHTMLSWYDVGHALVAAIAYQHLTPQAKKEADTILIQSQRLFEINDTFISAAIWADTIRHQGERMFDSWHTASIAYDPESTLSDKEKDVFRASWQGRNAPWAIEECSKILKNNTATVWQRGFSLRFLIHIVGDIHQPLHCCTLFNKQFTFPKGDRAGNLFVLDDPVYDTLHTLWDCVIGIFGERLHIPLTAQESRLISTYADNFIRHYPQSSFPHRDSMSPTAWQKESFELAVQYAYAGITPGEKISSEYRKRCQPIAEQRIVLAGYRLAQLLNELFTQSLDKK